MTTIAVLGTFDTKGPEHAFIAAAIRAAGLTPLLINVGTGANPSITPDLSSDTVARAAGEPDYLALLARRDRVKPSLLWGAQPRNWLVNSPQPVKFMGLFLSAAAAARPSPRPPCARCPSAFLS
ncbi:MAG: Tm-1-like ATP-binding domain-containing protein [Opitutaceae bacterium]